MRPTRQITLCTTFRERLAPCNLPRAPQFSMLTSLLGVLAFTCAGVSAADTVRVTNPATQPVLTSRVDEPARVPYQVQLTGPSATCGNLLSLVICEGKINGVPEGKRLVVQSVSGTLLSGSPPTNGQITVATESPAANYFGVANISTVPAIVVIPGQPSFANGYTSVFQSHQTVFIDGGVPARVYLTLSGATSGSQATITVTGYVIECTAAPCEAILTQ
jgi:hypothetical protein